MCDAKLVFHTSVSMYMYVDPICGACSSGAVIIQCLDY